MSKFNQFVFINAADSSKEVTVTVTGAIGWDFSAGHFIDALRYYKGYKLIFNIYSPGGSVFDALAVYDFLRAEKFDSEAFIWGLCGSAATLISCAAQSAYIGENSFFFIHNVENISDPDDERAGQITERLVSIYETQTGQKAEDIREWMNAETFFNSADAVKFGFVDGVTEESVRYAAYLRPNVDLINQTLQKMNLLKLVNKFLNKNFKDEAEAASFLTGSTVADFGVKPDDFNAKVGEIETKFGNIAEIMTAQKDGLESVEKSIEQIDGLKSQIAELVNQVNELKASKTRGSGNAGPQVGDGNPGNAETLTAKNADGMISELLTKYQK